MYDNLSKRMSWEVKFYKGVEKDVLKMPDLLQAKVLQLFDLLKVNGSDLGAPYSKALGKGLFELRAKSPKGIARSFYCFQKGKQVYILHAFVKKTQKLPKKEMDLAIKRKKEVEKNT